MKPSVHLQEVATGRCWVGYCADGPHPGKFITLGCGDFWVGRNPGCEIRLDHNSVSRHHAILQVIDTRLSLDDQYSRNGTRINDGPRQRRGRKTFSD